MTITGVNFRATPSEVTDGAGFTYCTAADNFGFTGVEVTRGGIHFNLSGAGYGGYDDPSPVDPRVAGSVVAGIGDGGVFYFDLTLPSAGTYLVNLASYVFFETEQTVIHVYDGLATGTHTLLFTVNGAANATPGLVLDAAGTQHASTAAWVASQAAVGPYSFSTGILGVIIQTTASDAAPLSTIYATSAASPHVSRRIAAAGRVGSRQPLLSF
jgi:hypothetical protein